MSMLFVAIYLSFPGLQISMSECQCYFIDVTYHIMTIRIGLLPIRRCGAMRFSLFWVCRRNVLEKYSDLLYC